MILCSVILITFLMKESQIITVLRSSILQEFAQQAFEYNAYQAIL